MALARDRIITAQDRFRIYVNSHSYVEQEIARGCFESNRVSLLVSLLNPGKPFVDVGANIGFYSLLAASSGSQVDAFEPAYQNYQRLCANRDLNHFAGTLRTYKIALGDQKGAAALYAPLSDNYGRVSLQDDQVGPSIGMTQIETLDGLLEIPKEPVVIKIDVEGFEDKVLAGATDWINHVPRGSAWIIEIHTSIGVDHERIAGCFDGYKVTYFCDDSGSESPKPQIGQGDLVMIVRKT